MTIRVCTVAVLAAFAASPPAFAHGDEGGGGGTILPSGTTRVTFGYDFVRFNGISDATLTALAIQGVEEVHSLKTISVPSVTIGYGLTTDLTLAMRLPYLHNQDIRETDLGPPPGVNDRGPVNGIGDASVTATYRFWHDESRGLEAALILGLKAPTGKTNDVDVSGEEFETEHQPGSGSWDGIFGASVSRELGPMTFSGNVLYGLSGEGSRDTTLGDRLSYGVAVSYRIWERGDHGGGLEPMKLGGRFDGMMHHGGPGHEAAEPHEAHDHHNGTTVEVSLGLNGDWLGEQDVAGELDGNTGGNVLYVTPGIKLTVDKWAGFVNFGVPVACDLNGIQPDPDWRLSTGVSVDF